MGAVDVERQALNVFRMRLLGAEVVHGRVGQPNAQGRGQRGAARLGRDRRGRRTTASARSMGPHPFPWMVREFQRVVGDEAREQCRELLDGDDPDVGRRLRRRRLERHRHVRRASSTPRTRGWSVSRRRPRPRDRSARRRPSTGACPGSSTACRSLFLQDEDGQILEAPLDQRRPRLPRRRPRARPARGGRAAPSTTSATDEEALDGFQLLAADRGHRARARARARDRLASPARRAKRSRPARRCWSRSRAGATRTPRRSPSGSAARGRSDEPRGDVCASPARRRAASCSCPT